MDSLNTLHGYGKIENLEHQSSIHHKTPTKKPLFFTITAIFLFTLIIVLTIAASIQSNSNTNTESPNSAIKSTCNVTRYPNSCFSSISSLNTYTKPDPELILKLSLKVSIEELTGLSSYLKTQDSHLSAAMGDCLSQLEDAVSRLNESVAVMEVGNGEKMLSEAKINDIQSWISGAMTDEETCLDGLEEMESSVIVGEMKKKMQRSKEFVSNSLAIVAHIHSLLDMFHMPLH